MHTRDIEIYCIAKTAIDYNKIYQWLSTHDAEDIDLPLQSQPATLVGLAGKRCYKSFKAGLNPNVTKIREDWVAYLDNVLQSGHGSVLEHASYTFVIENVSRVFTGEMNRHRAGVAISEGSMRYIRYEDIPFWMPLSIRADINPPYSTLSAEEKSEWLNLERKKMSSRRIFEQAFKQAQELYQELEEIWHDDLLPKSKFQGKKQITSMMRRIIPMGVCTGGLWTLNFRALRHVISMRADEAAEEEICHVFSQIGKYMVESEPEIFGDFEDVGGFWMPRNWKV